MPSFSVPLANTPKPSSLIIILNYEKHELIELFFSLFIFIKMCPASEKRSQDKRESLENSHEDLSTMFSEMQQAKVLYNTFESVEEVKESSDVILKKMSDGMRIHEENMEKIESAVEVQNQRIEELHKALNQILNIVKEKAEKEP